MAANVGLLGGIGQGLLQGVNSYNDARKMNLSEDKEAREAKDKSLANALAAKEHGFEVDPSGGLIETEYGKKKREADVGKTNAEAAWYRHRATTDKANEDAAKIQKQLQTNPNYLKADQGTREAENYKRAIDEAVVNPQAHNALGGYGARFLAEGQRMNQAEMQMMGGHSQDVLGKVGQIFQTTGSGTLTPANADFLKKFVDTMAKKHEETKGQIEDQISSGFARTHKMDPEAASGLIVGKPTYASRVKAQGLIPQADPNEGKTARNDKGERIVRKGGKWVPMTNQ